MITALYTHKHGLDIDGFEEWAKSKGYDLTPMAGIGDFNLNRYQSADTSNAFIGWIASREDTHVLNGYGRIK